MSKETFTQKELDTFQWDESVPELDFFGEVTKNPNLAVEESDKDDEGKEEEKKTEDLDVFSEFEVEKEKEEDVVEDTDDAEEKTDKTVGEQQTSLSNISVANFLKDKGIIDFELEEGQELEDIDAELLIEEGFESSVEKKVGDLMAGLPDKVKNMVKFAINGGDPDEYLSTVAKSTTEGISTKMDISKESNQEKFMRFKLLSEGNDEEFVDAQIEFFKDSGKLDSLATKAYESWKTKEDEKAATLAEEQRERVQKAKAAQIEYKKDIAKHLSEIESINNLKFTKKDAKELPDYIGEASVTLEDGRKITPFYRDLFESMKDKDKLVVIAKLVKSNLDLKDIETAVATKQAQKVKSDIQRQKEGKKISTASGSSQPKRLADYFN